MKKSSVTDKSFFYSMLLETMKERVQKVEKKKETRGVIGRGTGRGIGTEEEKGTERKARTEQEIEKRIGIVTKTVIGIMTVIIETAIGIEVIGGKEEEVEMMTITSGVETMTGNGSLISLFSAMTGNGSLISLFSAYIL